MKLALIGSGRWGSKYLEAVKPIKGCEIAYVATRDYSNLFAHTDIDGYIIATPASTHAQIIKAFPDKFLLVEKPLTTSYAETLAIDNPKIMVGYVYLYNLEYIAMKKRLKKLGKIRGVDFHLHNTDSYQSDTTVIWELGPHAVSVCIDLLGEPAVVEAIADSSRADIGLLFDTKYSTLSFGWDYLERGRKLTVFCDRGIASLDDTKHHKVSALENQLRTFVDFIHGKHTTTDVAFAKRVARVLDAAEQSATKHSEVRI